MKYQLLFVGLTFTALFLLELLAGLRIHPIQYLLVSFPRPDGARASARRA